MKCAVHTEVDATGYCRNCGKPMCAVCVRPVRDVLYCEDCLAGVMGLPPNAPPRRNRLRLNRTRYFSDPAPRRAPPGPVPPVAQAGAGPNPALRFSWDFCPASARFTTSSTARASSTSRFFSSCSSSAWMAL